MFIEQPFDQFLRFEYERHSDTHVTVSMPVEPLYLNSLGIIHGGIISSLADVAMCNTIESDEDNKQKAVTVDLNISFLKGARGSRLIAEAEIISSGKTLTHAQCLIYDENTQLVAKAKAVLFNKQ
ncbi:PaaI family thioesterase [Jeotgalibacillus sp. S-D1]|uniref:PaaI family thioesterase n=1 Tax=Jeotgalibacillus sp. S-D1 TaxID=2552189 RepID=UPI00105A075D|nr:PaaI family thioesterase [Jeotgalibacillus sp. S-D1]TDL34887.1 PaaI family thioesterase [Jeotgalibacillus sp. S-D1]